MVIVNSPIWKVIRIASPPFGKCRPTACRMCSALLQEQQIQCIIIFDRIQRKTGKHFKRFPVFLLVQQLRQALHRAAMVAGYGLGVKQTAQDAFLHALGHCAEERVDGVVVEHLQG